MTTKRLIGGSALVAILFAGAAFLQWGRGDTKIGSEVERDSNRQVRRAIRYSVVPDVIPELSWMYERGIEPRRIAGRVTINGSPAANIELSLRSAAMMYSKLSPPSRRSDAEGRFDFGDWPATQYAVVAGGGAYELAVEKIDLADPLVESDDLLVKLAACSREGFGTVTSLYGEEISGATLSVVTMMRQASWFTLASQPIESDGSFRLCLSRKRTDLRIDAPGFAQAHILHDDGYPMPEDGWIVQLLPAGGIRGKYVDTQGKGIAGGRVSIFRQGLSHHLAILQHAITDADGSFLFATVGPGKYEVTVDHFDYMGEYPGQTVSLAPGEEKDGIVLTGGDCRKIAGTVITEDGSPVVGAEVWGTAKSQGDGSFVISCAGFEAFELNMPLYRVLSTLVPAGTAGINDLVVRVASPNSLHGCVVADDKPVANAAITLRSEDKGKMPFLRGNQRTRSDDAGQYRFASVVPGTYSLEASTEGGASDTLSLEMTDSDVERDLVIEAGTQVSGTVSTEDGVPLAGIAVYFVSASGKETSVTTETEDGHFQIMVAGNESHEVSLRHRYSGHYEPPGGFPWPTIAARAGEIRLDLRIAGASQKLSGQVVFEDNSPAAYAKVTVFPTARDGQADQEGYFAFENLPAASYDVYATDLMGLKATVEEIVASKGIAKGVRIVIERGAMVIGVIIEGSEACKIELQGKDRRIANGSSFTFDDVPPGDYTIEAHCGQKVAAMSTTLAPGGRADLSLNLEPGLSIDGVVKQFPSGEPIANLNCIAGMTEARTDGAGHFRLDQVTSLVTEIHCMRFEDPMAFAQAPVSASKEAHHKIELWGFESTEGLEALVKDSGRLGAKLIVKNEELVFAEVEASGECGQLGIRNGDVLVSVTGVAVHGIEKVVEIYLQTLRVGASAEIEIRRGDTQMEFRFGS